MPITKSAKKALRQSIKRQKLNLSIIKPGKSVQKMRWEENFPDMYKAQGTT